MPEGEKNPSHQTTPFWSIQKKKKKRFSLEKGGGEEKTSKEKKKLNVVGLVSN